LGTTLFPDVILVGQWTAIYVVYAFTSGGFGVSMVYIDGFLANSAALTTNGLSPSAFSTSDIVKIGQGFTGKLKRIQIYSPAAFGLVQNPSKIF